MPLISMFSSFKILVRGDHPNSWKNAPRMQGQMKIFRVGFAAIPGIAPRVAPRIVAFVLIKSWEAIPRMEFRIPRMEFPIPRAAPRIPRNSPRAPRMALSLRERFSWNWGGPQASEKLVSTKAFFSKATVKALVPVFCIVAPVLVPSFRFFGTVVPSCVPSFRLLGGPGIRRGARGGKPRKVPRSTFLEANGVSKKVAFPVCFKKGTF